MKYELINKENNDYLNPLESVLKNRGIYDIKKFLKISTNVITHHSSLKNINRAVECLIHHIEKGGELFVQVDSDPQMAILRVQY